MSGSYIHRAIDVIFTKAQGTFSGTGKNTLTVSGLRTSVAITKAGGVSQGELDLRIWGMTPTQMNDLTLVGPVPLNVQIGNTVTVMAGPLGGTKSLAYSGTIGSAMTDYAGAPETVFHVIGLAALDTALMSVPPSSYPGTADVAVIMANLATLAGLRFQNSGVTGVKLSNPYLPGTPLTQIEEVAQAAGIGHVIDDGTLAIWPSGGARGGVVPLLSPATGLIGYPVRTPIGVQCSSLYNPDITFGATVQIQSSITQACGIWQVNGLNHSLDSEMPDGAWFTRLSLLPVGFI